MYINIYEMIQYIGTPSDSDSGYWWYNMDDGKLYGSDELQELYDEYTLDEKKLYLDGYIPFLETSHNLIIRQFIDSLNDKSLSKKFGEMDEERLPLEFGQYVERRELLFDRWGEFFDKRLAEKLILWCDENNIKYSCKKNPLFWARKSEGLTWGNWKGWEDSWKDRI